MLKSPILFREVITSSRKVRTFVSQAIFLAVMAGLMFFLLPNISGVEDPSMHAKIGREIFFGLAWLELILIALAAPAAAAATITLEKERNTLDLLLITDLSRFEIGLGKFFSRLYQIVVLVLLSLPFLAILLTVGGISGEEVLQVFAHVLALGVLALGLGFFFSVLVRKSYSAIVLSYVVLGCYAVAAWRIVGTTGLSTGYLISPIDNLFYILDPGTFGKVRPDDWQFNVIVHLIVGFGLAILGSYLLPMHSTFTRLFSLQWVKTSSRKEGSYRPVSKNPIYWLESSSTPFGRIRLGWASYVFGFLVLFAVTGFAAHFGWLDEKPNSSSGKMEVPADFYYWTFGVLNFLLIIVATVRAATSVVIQRENRSLILLATTPVTESTYLGGLIFGLTRSLLFLLVIPLGYTAAMVFAGYLGLVPHALTIWAIPYTVVVLSSTLAFYVVQGVFVSFMVHSSIRAVLIAVVLVVGELILPLAMCCCAFPINPVLIAWATPATTVPDMLANLKMQGMMIPAIIVASLIAQAVYCMILYSIMKSGFDRYLDRNI